MAKSITLASFAKINLYFNIVGKYSNGFHKIESIISRISLADKIRIKLLPQTKEIILHCNDKTLENSKNLCFQAAKLFQQELRLPFGFQITLEKRIPYGSGLGGASSNAAAVLLGINRLLGPELKRRELFFLGERLGSDVNFFLSEASFALVKEKGELVFPLAVREKYHFLLVYPNQHLSTKKVYQNQRRELTKYLSNVNILAYALRRRDFFLIEKSIFNALEKAAMELCPAVAEIKEACRRLNLPAQISGSGSTVFILSDNSKRSDLERLRNISTKKGWTLSSVQTI